MLFVSVITVATLTTTTTLALCSIYRTADVIIYLPTTVQIGKNINFVLTSSNFIFLSNGIWEWNRSFIFPVLNIFTATVALGLI